MSHTLTDYRIAASLINRFFKRLYSDQDDKQKIINDMKVKLHLENSLEKLVKTEKLNKKSLFVNIEATLVLGFPKLCEEIIKNNRGERGEMGHGVRWDLAISQ